MEEFCQYYTGRAIYASYSKLLINKSFFNNNIANYDYGGAIYARYSNITVQISEFSHNLAYWYRCGGAIYMYNENGNFKLQINGTIFYGSSAY